MGSAGKIMRKILDDYEQGKTQEYDLLLNQLLDKNTEPGILKNYLKGLRDCVSLVNRSKEALIGTLMKMDWLNNGEGVVKAYQELLVNLMSASTNYLHASINMLIKYLLPDMSSVPKTDNKYIVDDETRHKHEDQFIKIHEILKETCQIVPLAPVILMPILEKSFPFHMLDIYIQSCYVKNLIQITLYIPSIRQQILELVTSKIMKLDVLSPRSKLSEQDEEDEEEEMFDMDDGESAEKVEAPKEMKLKEANCLDKLMEMLFNYIYNICHPNGAFDFESSRKLYWELVKVFEKIILPTHESCHVQYIMFYITSFKPVLADGWLDYLWKMVQNPNTPIVFRQTAISYMASLLARASFIPILTVISCMDLMVAWLHNYIDNLTESKQADDLLHGTFYAVSQAVFYLFCFRNTEIFQTKKGYKWAESLNFQRIVTSRLNPLRYCLPIVVNTFSSYTRRHQLAFCDTVIERNNRCLIPTVNNSTGQTDNHFTLILASFFPFDPYLLPNSGKIIEPIYRIYQGDVHDDDKDDHSSEEEDDFLPEVDQTDATNMIISPSHFSLPKQINSDDLMMYATSPGFKRT